MPIVGKPRRTLSEATPPPPPAAPPSIVWPSTGKRTLQRSKVVWGDLTISVGDDVVLDYGASVPGIARVKGFRRKGKGDAATIELLVSWFYVPGDSGTTRTADHYVEEVWKAARETIDAVPVESACYKLRVHDSLEAFEDGHEPDDYFVFGTIRFSKKRDACAHRVRPFRSRARLGKPGTHANRRHLYRSRRSGAVILRPRVDRQLKPVPRLSDLRLPPPPLKLWSEADRVPLDIGIGFWALRLPDSRMVLPVNAPERDEDSLLTAAVYALRAVGGESGAQFCVQLGEPSHASVPHVPGVTFIRLKLTLPFFDSQRSRFAAQEPCSKCRSTALSAFRFALLASLRSPERSPSRSSVSLAQSNSVASSTACRHSLCGQCFRLSAQSFSPVSECAAALSRPFSARLSKKP